MERWTQYVIIILLAFIAFQMNTSQSTGLSEQEKQVITNTVTSTLSSISGDTNSLVSEQKETTSAADSVDSSVNSFNNDFLNEDFAQESTQKNIDDNTSQLQSDFSKILGPSGESVDAFGNVVQKDAISLLSIPSNHPYTPERLRVLVNGTRQFIMYNGGNEYEKAPDAHYLRPPDGQNVTLETAESIPYIVHYENWYSWAFDVNRTLQTGDFIRVGAFNEDNGYFIEHNSTHGPLEAVLKTRRNGTIVNTEPVTLEETLQNFTRLELRSNWYNVGRQQWIQTTTDTDREQVQRNFRIGTTAPEGNRSMGPESPTLPLRWQVHRGTGNAPIQMNAGSGAIMIAGSGEVISRLKVDQFTVPLTQQGEWEPIAALRLDPDKASIRAEFDELDAAQFDADANVALVAQSHSPRKVASETGEIPIPDDQFSRPELQSVENSIIDFTTNVSAAANETGDVVETTNNKGGFQIGWGSLYTSENKGVSGATLQVTRKRPVYGSDVVVFWARVKEGGNPSLPADLTVEYLLELDY